MGELRAIVARDAAPKQASAPGWEASAARDSDAGAFTSSQPQGFDGESRAGASSRPAEPTEVIEEQKIGKSYINRHFF